LATYPELELFTKVHTIRKRQMVFTAYRSGKAKCASIPYHVFIDRPAATSGITVAPVSDAHSDMLFNLPCTIAGGKGTVRIDSKSLIDTYRMRHPVAPVEESCVPASTSVAAM
jgi:hypothetical protein